MGISQNMWDDKNVKDIYNMSTCQSKWSDAEKEWMFYYAKASQASTGEFAARDGNGLFLPACMNHVTKIGGKNGKGVQVNGLGYLDVLGDWFYDRGQLPHVVTDACDSVQSCLGTLAKCPE